LPKSGNLILDLLVFLLGFARFTISFLELHLEAHFHAMHFLSRLVEHFLLELNVYLQVLDLDLHALLFSELLIEMFLMVFLAFFDLLAHAIKIVPVVTFLLLEGTEVLLEVYYLLLKVLRELRSLILLLYDRVGQLVSLLVVALLVVDHFLPLRQASLHETLSVLPQLLHVVLEHVEIVTLNEASDFFQEADVDIIVL